MPSALNTLFDDTPTVRIRRDYRPAKLFHGADMLEAPCAILSASDRGARLELTCSHAELPSEVWFVEPGRRTVCRARVAWRVGATVGIAFTRRIKIDDKPRVGAGILGAIGAMFGRPGASAAAMGVRRAGA